MKRKTLSLREEKQEKLFAEAFQILRRTKVNNNLSEKTIIHYDGIYELFRNYLSNADETYCSDITTDDIEGFIEFLKKRNPNIRATTINSYLRDLRTMLYYFMERGYMDRFSIKLLRVDKQIKKVYTDNEISLLLQKPDLKKCDFSEYRNWVITCYLLATGNRIGTVCELRIEDIDFGNSIIHLRKTKTRKAYNLPMSDALEKILTEYMQYRKGESTDFLFCNKYGDRLQESSLNTAIYRYNRRKGVIKTSAHLYRNTFAKMYLTKGGDIARLQKLLCHSTPTMSLQYADMYEDELDYNFVERNPLDIHMKDIKNNKALNMAKK